MFCPYDTKGVSNWLVFGNCYYISCNVKSVSVVKQKISHNINTNRLVQALQNYLNVVSFCFVFCLVSCYFVYTKTIRIVFFFYNLKKKN